MKNKPKIKIKKAPSMKVKGLRVDEGKWERMRTIAERDETGHTKVSDVARIAFDEFLDRHE